jgi:hypothetical protein
MSGMLIARARSCRREEDNVTEVTPVQERVTGSDHMVWTLAEYGPRLDLHHYRWTCKESRMGLADTCLPQIPGGKVRRRDRVDQPSRSWRTPSNSSQRGPTQASRCLREPLHADVRLGRVVRLRPRITVAGGEEVKRGGEGAMVRAKPRRRDFRRAQSLVAEQKPHPTFDAGSRAAAGEFQPSRMDTNSMWTRGCVLQMHCYCVNENLQRKGGSKCEYGVVPRSSNAALVAS